MSQAGSGASEELEELDELDELAGGTAADEDEEEELGGIGTSSSDEDEEDEDDDVTFFSTITGFAGSITGSGVGLRTGSTVAFSFRQQQHQIKRARNNRPNTESKTDITIFDVRA